MYSLGLGDEGGARERCVSSVSFGSTAQIRLCVVRKNCDMEVICWVPRPKPLPVATFSLFPSFVASKRFAGNGCGSGGGDAISVRKSNLNCVEFGVGTVSDDIELPRESFRVISLRENIIMSQSKAPNFLYDGSKLILTKDRLLPFFFSRP